MVKRYSATTPKTQNSATVMVPPAAAMDQAYRIGANLDKDGATREATEIMTVVVPIGHAKPEPAAQPERVGVLLVNLGTPDTADARGVRVYLKEFLSDKRVIEDQGLLWKLILNGVILRIRPRRKARDYQKIWNTEKNESPLKTITRGQARSSRPPSPTTTMSWSTGRCATAIPRSARASTR